MRHTTRSVHPALLASALLVPAVAPAGGLGGSLATVTDVSGVVLIGGGDKFNSATVGAKMSAGTRIMTMEGAKATLSYDDGCKLQLGGNTMVAVRQADECTQNTVESEVVEGRYAALGESKVAADSAGAAKYEATFAPSGVSGASTGFAGVSTAGLIVGVAAVGTGVYFAAKGGDNNNDFEVSGENF